LVPVMVSRCMGAGLAIIAIASVLIGAQVDARAGEADLSQIVAGPSNCPSPQDVVQHLVPLIPSDATFEGLRAISGGMAPVQVVDLGSGVRVSVGDRSREYPDPSRDCAKRAQFAAVFVALVLRNPSAVEAPPVVPPEKPVVQPAPVVVPVLPRARVDLGPTAGVDIGSGRTTIAPGGTLRVAFGRRRLIPVMSVTGLLPVNGALDGVDVRRWEALADVDVRVPLRAGGRAVPYLEVGGAASLIVLQPLNLAIGRSQTTYAFGPRAAAGLILGGSRLASFVLVGATWFPAPPSISALPNGVLGHTPSFTIGATAGVSLGWR
jgi:hypothetical protein